MPKRKSTKGQTKDRVTRTTLKPGGALRCSGRVSSSCSTSDTRRVYLVSASNWHFTYISRNKS